MMRTDTEAPAGRSTPDGVTLGVEEEFLLVDRRSLRAAPRADAVLSGVPRPLQPYVRRELLDTQVEIATPICLASDELRAHLVTLRRAVAASAQVAGCRLVAAGASILDGPQRRSGTWPPEGTRAEAMRRRFGAMIDVQGLCACHVHVGVGDREVAVAVSNHVRPWLPVLQAMCANSPYADGRDSGHASWRSVLWARRPTAGPPPWLRSAAHFDNLVEALLGSPALLDRATLFWYARPSAIYPTIELRVGDVCAAVDDAVLVAALARALVRTAVLDVHAGRDAPSVEDQLLAAAHWTAARFGLEGDLFDALTARTRPAWQVVADLIDHVKPALNEAGDAESVEAMCAAVRTTGSGAARQRRIFAKNRDLQSVVRYLATQATAG
jgi:glutamate---cysteine ligase / carboxylate-amine ligase